MSRVSAYLEAIIIFAFFVSTPPSAHAQFTPVTAKIIETVETIVDGKVAQMKTRTGNFYRAADGSELRQWLKPDGTPDWGDLNDNKTRLSYKLDYTNRVARGTTPPPGVKAAPLQPGFMGGQQALSGFPQDAVAGIPCAVVPAKLARPGSQPIEIGHVCKSVQYDLELRMDLTTQVVGTSKTVHQVIELQDIQLGVVPDPKLFDLQGYTVSMP